MERETEYIKAHRKKTEIHGYVLPIGTARKPIFEQTKAWLALSVCAPAYVCSGLSVSVKIKVPIR